MEAEVPNTVLPFCFMTNSVCSIKKFQCSYSNSKIKAPRHEILNSTILYYTTGKGKVDFQFTSFT